MRRFNSKGRSADMRFSIRAISAGALCGLASSPSRFRRGAVKSKFLAASHKLSHSRAQRLLGQR